MREFAQNWGWAELLKIGLVLARGVLGLFVSSALGGGLYVLTLPVVLSIWGYGSNLSLTLLLLIAMSLGAGVGSYITWFERDLRLGAHALLFAVALGCALVGAYLGLLRGLEVGLLHPIWRPGIPETSVTAMGAVISANIPLLALALYRAIKNPRL